MEAREEVVREYTEEALFEQLLTTLLIDRDDPGQDVLRCNLLVFLQEHVTYFLEEDGQR